MSKLKHVLSRGLEQTAALWTPIAVAYEWVHQAALILNNQADLEAAGIQYRFSQLLTMMNQEKTQVEKLADGIDHFLKVTSSYWSGLFHCYQVEALPRTNNDLEHLFAQLRHHQRRVTGRKAAPASLVLRGSVRLIAAVLNVKQIVPLMTIILTDCRDDERSVVEQPVGGNSQPEFR